MSIRQRDVLLRMLEQLAGALAAVAGLREAGKLDEATALWRETADGVIGPSRSMIDSVDAGTAAMLLGGVERLRAYADLVDEDARLREARGDARGASAARARAVALRAEIARAR